MGRVFRLLIVVIAVVWIVSESVCGAEEGLIRVSEGRVSLRVREKPLQTVLETMASEAGFVLAGKSPVERPVSWEVEGVPVEEAVRRLLNRENYVLVYSPASGPPEKLVKVVVLGPRSGPVPSVSDAGRRLPDGVWSDVPVRIAQPGISFQTFPKEPIRRLEKAAVLQRFSHPEEAFAGCRGEPVAEEGRAPAVRITRLPESSPLRALGLNEGDVVSDVNGRGVGTLEDLAAGIYAGLQGSTGTLRIERRTPEGGMDPVYVELQ